jgi:hypothetical protein
MEKFHDLERFKMGIVVALLWRKVEEVWLQKKLNGLS